MKAIDEGVQVPFKTIAKPVVSGEASACSHECGDAGCGTPVVGLNSNLGSAAAGNQPSDAQGNEGQIQAGTEV